MSDDYDVVWNGTNDGQDGDLLNRTAVTAEKKPPPVAKRWDTNDLVEAALPTREADRDGVTLEDLASRTALSKGTVNKALDTLKRRGRIVSTRAARERQRY